MAESNLIHIKLEHSEAIQGKRDLLSSEANLLRVAQTIRRYRLLRASELKTKAKLHRKIKETNTIMKKLEQVLPKVKIPQMLQEEIFEEGTTEPAPTRVSKAKSKNKKETHDSDIEKQLRHIQDRLKKLQ